MGNKMATKSKTSSDGSKKSEVKRRQKKNGAGSAAAAAATKASRDKKVISCPDLSGAVPYKFDDDSSRVDVKIYRSYLNLSEPAEKRLNALSDPAPDIRVYRRSTGNLPMVDADDKSQTLPRTFGRSRSAVTSVQQQHRNQQNPSQQSNGSLPRDRRSDGGEGVVRRRSTLGSGYNMGAARGSRRTLSTASMNSIGYKVNPEDFPDTTTIKRRLTLFETSFVRSFVEVFFSDLSETVLLSLLSIAIRPDRANQQVSLLQYLQSSDIPANLHEQGTSVRVEYILTIPQMLFKEIFRIRRDNINDLKAWIAIGRHIMSCQAMEAANELSRVFEYQLSLMPESGLPMELLCRHSAQCVQEFLKRNGKYLDRNTIVHGVTSGCLRMPEVCPKFSIILGERELKWNLFEIFKKPGLRKELFLLSVNEEVDVEQSPWKYYSSLKGDPMLYGYRGLIVDWDFASSSYQLNGEDEASFPEEMDWRPDDFHRDYNPYRRLVGLTVMRDFCAAAATAGAADKSKGLTLGDYVRNIQGRSYSRDRVQPVYRPLEDGDGLRDRLPLESVNLGNADTLRLRKGRKRPDAPGQTQDTESKPQRASDLGRVSMSGVPQEKRTTSLTTDTSPISRTDADLSPGSTISQDSQHSSKMRYKTGLHKTGSPERTGSTPQRDDSAVSKQTDDTPRHTDVQVGVNPVEDTDPVVSGDATETTTNSSVDEDEGVCVQTALKPSQVVSNISRRSTITSDV